MMFHFIQLKRYFVDGFIINNNIKIITITIDIPLPYPSIIPPNKKPPLLGGGYE